MPRRRSRGRSRSRATRSWKTMKLASRISSMRRMHGSSAGRARPTRTRCGATRSPAPRSRDGSARPLPPAPCVTGCWASQSISRSGTSRRSSLRSRRRAGRARARSATRCRARGCGGSSRGSSADAFGRGSTKSRSSRFTLTGSRACGPCPAPSSMTSSPPVASASAAPRPRAGESRPRCPGSPSPGSARGRSSRRKSSAGSMPRGCVSISVSRVGLEAPADAVLDLLRRVRLGEHPARRRTRGSPGSPSASSGGCTSPSPRRCRARSSNA